MGRFAHPYGDDNRLPEGMFCIGYDADTGCKSYVDTEGGGVYTGEPYAEYGVLRPVKRRTTAREDNLDYGREVYNEGEYIPTVDCESIIPRRPQTKEKRVEPKYRDILDGVGASSQVSNRSKKNRASTVGTWLPKGWGPHLSATAVNQDPSEDEKEADAPDSGGPSDHEEEIKQTTTPYFDGYIFDEDTLTFVPLAGGISESPTDSIPNRPPSPVPLVVDQRTSRRHTVGGVSQPSVEPQSTMGSAEKKKKRRTLLHRLLRVNL